MGEDGSPEEIVAHESNLEEIPDLEEEEVAIEEIEATEEADVEEEEAEEAEEDLDDDQPDEQPKPAGKDKALTRLQQRQSTVENQLNTLGNQMSELIEAIKANPDGKPTEKQEEAVEEAKDELTEVLDGLDDDDIIDGAQFKRLAKQFKAPDVQAAIDKALEKRDLEAQQQQTERDQAVQAAEQDFNAQHPTIEGQFSDVAQAATAALHEAHGEDVPREVAQYLFNTQFYPEAIEAAEQKAASGEAPTPQRKAGTKSRRTAKGASIKPSGASAKVVAGQKIVAFDHDPDFIPDLTGDT